MTDEPTELAVTPAAAEPASTPAPTSTASDDDGFVDLDAKPADTPADEENDEGDEPAEATTEEDKAPKKLSGAQRAKIREQRLLAEADELRRENERLRTGGTKTPADAAGGVDPKAPREEDFNGDYFAFTKAATAYEAAKAAAQAVRDEYASRENTERAKRERAAAQERQLAHAERVEEAKSLIKDFDQAMEGMKDVNVRPELIEEIMSSDKSAYIAYHLAKNPEVLAELNRLNPRELARAMGRLEVTVEKPASRKQTSAPPPPSRLRGAAAPHSQEAELAAYLDKKYPDRRK